VLAASLFDPLYHIIGWLLAILYLAPPHSLGLAIIVMTIIVMALQFPLIAKQTRSMLQMQRVQPEIKKIQQKYKDDRAKQNEELLKFYQENKINPLAGCLPLLLIFPIGIAVFGTFRDPGIQAHIPRTGTANRLYVDLCGKATTPPGVCKRAIKEHTPSAMHFLGLKLNLSTAEALRDGVVQAIPWLILLAIVVLTGWYQVRQTQARQSKQGAPVNKQMQTITRVMPVFFGFISFRLNAATTLYFAVSNGWRIGQQHFVLNKMYDEEHAAAEARKAKPPPKDALPADDPPQDAPPPKSGGQARRNPGGGGSTASGGGASKPRPAGSNPPRRKKKRKR